MKTLKITVASIVRLQLEEKGIDGYLIESEEGKKLFRSKEQIAIDMANSDLGGKPVMQLLPGCTMTFAGEHKKKGEKYPAQEYHVKAKFAKTVGQELVKENDGYVVNGFCNIVLSDKLRTAMLFSE